MPSGGGVRSEYGDYHLPITEVQRIVGQKVVVKYGMNVFRCE